MLQKRIVLFLFIVSFLYSHSKKTLVLLDDWHNVEINSIFWNQITEMGYEIEFKMANDKEIKLTNYDEYNYENIIFFAPTYVDSNKNDITIEKLLTFIHL